MPNRAYGFKSRPRYQYSRKETLKSVFFSSVETALREEVEASLHASLAWPRQYVEIALHTYSCMSSLVISLRQVNSTDYEIIFVH